MRNIFILLFFTQLAFSSSAQTITVKQDGTGDYTNIQAAVDASSDGDTVLVWPGTYFENIEMNGHNITLASLDLITDNPQYKYNTIIDGGSVEQASCVWTSTDTDFIIQGFTIQNGTGRDLISGGNGGGLFLSNSTVSIINCIIKNNFARKMGGGILAVWTNLFLSGTTIKNNHAATDGGGGIHFRLSENGTYILKFDTLNLCNIFDNYACFGSEIDIGTELPGMIIRLDTFSVSSPGRQHLYSNTEHDFPQDRFTIDMNHYLKESVNADIFVNPLGNDSNSGLNQQEPLKSITKAMQIIVSDSLQKNTIHLANGTYSPSTTGEYFPIGLWTNINIIGQSRDSTILDAEHFTNHLYGKRLEYSFHLKNLSLVNGMGDYSKYFGLGSTGIGFNDSVLIKNVIFRNNTGYGRSALGAGSCSNTHIEDVVFINNFGGKPLGVISSYFSPEFPRLTDSVFINNCIFSYNLPISDSAIGYGGAFHTSSIRGDLEGDSLITIITNCVFDNNVTDNGIYPGGIVQVYDGSHAVFSNCTFGDNTTNFSEYSRVFGVSGFYAKAEVYNSIFYGGYPRELYIGSNEAPCELSIYNSLVEGGYEGIGGDLEFNVLYYDSTNIDNDPNFLGMWGDPYMIADGSPCIDAGTLANLPDFIEIPEFDLAGNPRIVGDSIDMGAYEWNPTIVGFNEIGPGNREEKPKLLKVSPNPFDWGTYIEVSTYAKASADKEVKVEVYDNYGVLVRNILTTTLSQDQEILWYGDDNNGNPLPAGIYHVVMFYGEREVESLKLIKK